MATKNKVQVLLEARDKTKKAFDAVDARAKKLSKTFAGLKKFIGPALFATATAGIAKLVTASQKATNQMADFSLRLGDSAESLSAFAFAAEATGIQVSQSTIALQRQTRRIGEAAQGYGEAADAIKRLGLDAKELANLTPTQAFEQISESLTGIENQSVKIATAFKLWDTEGVGLVQTLDEVARFKKLAEESGAVVTPEEVAAARGIRDAFTELRAESRSLGQNLTVIFGPVLEKGIQLIEWMVRQFRKFTAWIIETGQSFGLFKDAVVETTGAFSDIAPVADKTAKSIDDMVQNLKNQNEIQHLILQGHEDIAAKVRVIQQAEKQLGLDRYELSKEQQALLNDLVQKNLELNAAIKIRAEEESAYARAQQAAQKAVEEALEKQKQFADDVAATMTSAFEEAILSGNKLSDIFEGLLKDLAQMVIRMAVLRPLSNAISGAISPFIPQYATGTNYHPGGLAVVGEKGPELVSLPKGSAVTPNNRMGGTVVNINNNTAAEATVTETQQGDTRVIEVMIEDVVARSISGNGTVARSMQSSFGSRRQGALR
jgi:hypothetical protein